MEKTWRPQNNPAQATVELLQEEVSLDYRTAFILAQRHISSFDEAKSFFRPDIGQLHDPFQMKDMGENLFCFGVKSFFANKFNGIS